MSRAAGLALSPAFDGPAELKGSEERRAKSWHRLALALVFVTGLCPIGWYRPTMPIIGIDSFFSLFPGTLLNQVLAPWSTAGNPGTPNSQLAGLPVYAMEYLLSRLQVPLAAAQIVIVCLLSCLATLGAYRLLRAIVDVEQVRVGVVASEIGSVAAAVLWTVSPLALAQVWYRQTFLEVTWALLPWLVMLAVRAATDTSKSALMYYFYGCGLGLAGSAGLPEAYLPGVALLTCVWLGPVICRVVPERGVAGLSRLVAAAAGVFTGVAWWLIPAIPLLQTLVKGASLSPPTQAELQAFSPFMTVARIMTMTDAPLLWQRVGPGEPRFESWAGVITQAPGFGIPFLIPAIALVGVAFTLRGRARKYGVVNGAAWAVGAGVVVAKGLNPPVSQVATILTHLPFGSVFRDPASTVAFVAALPLCGLFGLGVSFLLGLSVPWRVVAVASIILVDGVSSAAWWTGRVVPERVGILPSSYVVMPHAYSSFGQWLATQSPGGKVMVIPYSQFGGSAFRWSSGADTGLDCVLPGLVSSQIFLCGNTNVGLADVPGTALAEGLKSGSRRVFALAWLWGIGTWVAHRDWNFAVEPATYSGKLGVVRLEEVARRLKSGSARTASRVFWSKDLISIRQPSLPLVYAAAYAETSSVRPTSQAALAVAEALMSQGESAVVVPRDIGRNRCRGSVVLSSGGETGGLGGVVSGQGSACIIFGETFSPGWRLVLIGGRGAVVRHFVANWWQNGWVVKVRGQARWKLVYEPGQVVGLGLDVGESEWVCLAGVGAYFWLRRGRRWAVSNR